MDLYEMHRETVADMVSAWRAVGYEPATIYLNATFTAVSVETAEGCKAALQHGFGRWFAEVNAHDLGTFDTLADAIGALTEPLRDGVLARMDPPTREHDGVWRAIALRRGGAWCIGPTREEAIAAALAVRP